MATLTGNKVKDSYQSLLKLSSGGATSTIKTVEDGLGVETALKVGTDTVEVNSLKITTTPTTSSSENTVMVYDDATNEVKVRELNTSAFQSINSFSNIAVSGQTTVVADSGTDTLTLAAGSNVTITTDETTDTVTIAADGGVFEESFVGYVSSTTLLESGGSAKAVYAAASNTTEDSSYHFGISPAKLELATSNDYIENVSGSTQVVMVDMSAFIHSPSNANREISFTMEKYSSGSWSSVGGFAYTTTSTVPEGVSFWGMYVLADGDRLRVDISSVPGGVGLNAGSLIRYVVRSTGNIL